MAQEHPTAAAMASFISVQGCRLPRLKPSKLSNSPKSLPNFAGKRYPNHARRQKPPQGHSNGSRAPPGRSNGFLYAFKGAVCQASNAPNPPKVRPAPQGKGTPTSPTRATPARKSHHKATAMAQEHPTAAAMASFIGVQGSRLPGLKPSKPSNSSKSLPNSAGKRYPNKPNTRDARRQKPPQGHSNGSRAPHGRSNGFLYAFKAAVCQASNPPNAPKVRSASQGKGTPTSPTRATPARKSHHKATAMAEGHPPAAAMAIRASYRRSRLPFARPQTLQTLQILQKSAQLRRQEVPQQAQQAPRPHAKATTRPWLLLGIQGCRLPGLKPSKPSNSSKSLPNSAGKRYPNKPNTRHARRQRPPQGHSNGSRAPPGRSNGFL